MDKAPTNNAIIKDEIMTVTIYLDGKDAAYAEAIGSLVLAQDLVKKHFHEGAMRKMMKEKTQGIIKPGLVN